MSDTKLDQEAVKRFKAAFRMAEGAMEEMKRQAELRRDLGHGLPADALDATRGRLEKSLASAKAAKDAETLAAEAQTALDASTSAGVLRAVEVLLSRIAKSISVVKSDKTKGQLDARHKNLMIAYGKMDAETPKPEIEELEARATELLNETLKAGPGDKQETKEERNAIYKDMLHARYRMQDARSSPADRLHQLGGFLRKEVNDQVKLLPDDETGSALTKQHKELQQTYSTIFDKGDQRTNQDVDKLELQVMELVDKVTKARGKPKQKEELQRIYEAKLANPFDIRAPAELDRLYAALSMVPPEHVAHGSLSEVQIGEDDDVMSIGDYSGTAKRIRINMAKVTKHPNLEYTYEINGRKVKQKLGTFNAATLHEVGHSIDDRAGVMKNPSDPTYGGWNTKESVDTVADAYFKELEGKFKGGEAATYSKELKDAIKSALGGQESKKPDDMPWNVWNRAEDTVKTCRNLAADTKPWRKPLPIGDRVYHKDNNQWLSYSMQARNNFTVRDYQWRSPVEWFAELYAVSWLVKTPHSGLPAPVAKFMYQPPQ